MFASATPRLTPTTGGRSDQAEPAHPKPEYRAIGVMYCKDADPLEFRVIYLAGLPKEVKDVVSELFGIGAFEWRVCP